MKRILLIISIVFCGIANAQYTKLYDFVGSTSDGSNPCDALVSDGTFLYGMTVNGGINNLGTVFKIRPDGTGYLKLLDFSGTTNGSSPIGSLIFDGTFLYGMTASGGTNTMGTIFKIMPDGTGYLKLMDFTGALNGSQPYGSLISDGTFLYGMTTQGGVNSIGTIFKIKPDGTGYVKLYDFIGFPDGNQPRGSLFFDGTYLYGMAYYGGTSNGGTVFKIMPDGTGYLKLMDFTGSANGNSPYGSLISDGTFLYGMTSYGGINSSGTLFKIMPDGTGYSKLMDFAGTAVGSMPARSVVFDGTFLYGMTINGGTSNTGVLFKIMPNGTGYLKLMDFAGVSNGSIPQGSLISDGTFLYGTTSNGGSSNTGTIFKYQFNTTTNIFKNNEGIDFAIYPNPSSGEFSFQETACMECNSFKVEIYNVLGKLVYYQTVNFLDKMSNGTNSKQETINLSSESNGIYFVKIKTKKGTITKKIIISK